MFFAPHILQVKVVTPGTKDEFGRITEEDSYEWKELGNCRCDDVSANKVNSTNGALYDFKYKVVFDKSLGYVAEDSDVRCLNQDGSIRGQGVVRGPLETNYLGYRVIWLE